jgi:membrane dipeptidase
MHGLACFLLIVGLGFALTPETGPAGTFADGHVHSGFAYQDGSLVARMVYFARQRLGAACLSLPIDSSKTGALLARIGEEVRALRRLAAGQNGFRLYAGRPQAAGPPGAGVDLFLSLEYFHGMFNGDAGLVNEYRKLGIRAITLIDNRRDPLFSGEKLTPFAERVIALMNGSGMLIDVTHLDSAQKLAVIGASKSPVIVSHTNARSVADEDYNIPDDVLAALKKNRGSVLVSFNRNGVFTEGGEKTDGIAKVADHIDHFVKWLGAGHVGIGSDYQADGRYVAAPLAEAEAFARISAELARRGYDASAIRAIMGGNVIRLFGE